MRQGRLAGQRAHGRGVVLMSKMSPGVLAPPRELLTPEQWKQRGREHRQEVPRLSHAQWEPPPDRPDPVDILEEQARTRVPDLVPIRYGRMFAAPDRRLVFDVNDFDETLPAPFEWDLKRLAASFTVAAREQEFSDKDAHTAARQTVRSYRTEMFRYATMRFLKVWYSRIDIDEVTSLFDELQPKKAVKRRRSDIAKARQRTSLKAFLKLCDKVDGQYRIRPAHPVIVRYPIERHPGVLAELRHAVGQYQETLVADRREVLRRYYFGDFARKVVGVGSVGTEAFILLLIGDRPDEPLFLQLKEAQESVLAPFAGKSEFTHQGERVVKGQLLTQAASDPFLGWTSGLASGPGGLLSAAKDYYVRQLRHMKGSMSVSLMDPDQLSYYGRLCGWALSRAHARTGRATLISGYLGGGEEFDQAVADFAIAYADQNDRDYQRLRQAVSDARVLATVGQ